MGEMNTFLTSSHPSLVKLSSKLEGGGAGGALDDLDSPHHERDGGSSSLHHHRKGTGNDGPTAAGRGRPSSDPDEMELAVKDHPSSSSSSCAAAPPAPLTSSDPKLGSTPQLSLSAAADASAAHSTATTPDPSGVVSPEHPPVAGPAEETTTNTSGTHPHLPPVQQQQLPPSLPPLPSSSTTSSASSAPLKATSFAHLRLKYLHELEYMLTEFQKLERQLLGAKAATRESDGSRERREKLHSFIVHLQDTIQQIKTGCQLEFEGKSTVPPATEPSSGPSTEDGNKGSAPLATKASSSSSGAGDALKGSALLHLTTEKREEETVQKLEEHILANLLPVKVRLKKQLAAQQGAKHNPAGMPVRGTALAAPPPSSALSSSGSHHHHHHDKGKATFAPTTAEENRRRSMGAATATSSSSSTKFGMPLEGGGSCLTQKLHGPTLGSGSANRLQEGGATAGAIPCDTKIRYAGLAIGSDQHESSFTAASAVHEMVIKDPTLMELARHKHPYTDDDTDLSLPETDQDHRKPLSTVETTDEPDRVPSYRSSSAARTAREVTAASAAAAVAVTASRMSDDNDPVLRRLVKKKRKRRKLREESSVKESQQQPPDSGTTSHCNNNNSTNVNTKKGNQGTNKRKKRGPWPVEYMCALCNEVYGSTCEYNPWWALQQQECPKCHKTQVRTKKRTV